MIKLWGVRYPKSISKGEEFVLEWSMFYLTFPFLKLFTALTRNDIEIYRSDKRIYFFIGIKRYYSIERIEVNTTYNIKVGYKE